jgi:hypothetical protein
MRISQTLAVEAEEADVRIRAPIFTTVGSEIRPTTNQDCLFSSLPFPAHPGAFLLRVNIPRPPFTGVLTTLAIVNCSDSTQSASKLLGLAKLWGFL